MVINAIRKFGADNVVVIPVGTRWKDMRRNQVHLSFGESIRVDSARISSEDNLAIDRLTSLCAEKIKSLCLDNNQCR